MVSHEHIYALVTGANSGLGLNVCYRLIDDFIWTKPQTSQLTLIFTTRSPKKGTDTLKLLEAHRRANHSSHQINFLPENVELTDLHSVRTLSQHLLSSSIPKLDAIILNAGIIGVVGINWPVAIWTVCTDTVNALTWPVFKLTARGLITKPQLPIDDKTASEPPLGEVFCANVFGHYLLGHWLMPLLSSCCPRTPGKVIWVGSVETAACHFNSSDLQGLRSPAVYEHSKRLTDLLVLTAYDQPATSRSVQSYLTPNAQQKTTATQQSTPEIHLVHPGICVTSIVPMFWILSYAFTLAAYLSRLLGSPWALVSPYNGAYAISWLTLANNDAIEAKKAEDKSPGEEVGGSVKWGSAVSSRFGGLKVRKTEVEGWGIDGSGAKYGESWWGGKMGRRRGALEANTEDVEMFVEEGARVWKEMERLRVEWEKRLEEH